VKSLTARSIFAIKVPAVEKVVAERRHYAPLSPADDLHYLREPAQLASETGQLLAIYLLAVSSPGSGCQVALLRLHNCASSQLERWHAMAAEKRLATPFLCLRLGFRPALYNPWDIQMGYSPVKRG
jgi:hypothetical protein